MKKIKQIGFWIAMSAVLSPQVLASSSWGKSDEWRKSAKTGQSDVACAAQDRPRNSEEGQSQAGGAETGNGTRDRSSNQAI